MSDRIEGVAVLNEQVSPAQLFFVCVRANGDRPPWPSMIPVIPVPRDRGHSWSFSVRGELLDVAPSVRISNVVGYDVADKPIMREIFHNPGAWSVRFERWTGDPRDASACYDRLRELNAGLLSP